MPNSRREIGDNSQEKSESPRDCLTPSGASCGRNESGSQLDSEVLHLALIAHNLELNPALQRNPSTSSNSSTSSVDSESSTASIDAVPMRIPQAHVSSKYRNSTGSNVPFHNRDGSISSVRTITPFARQNLQLQLQQQQIQLQNVTRPQSTRKASNDSLTLPTVRRNLADLDIREVLGEGSYSTVHRCIDKVNSPAPSTRVLNTHLSDSPPQHKKSSLLSNSPESSALKPSLSRQASEVSTKSSASSDQSLERSSALNPDTPSPREYAIKILSKRQLIKENKVKYANVERDTLTLLNSRSPSHHQIRAREAGDASKILAVRRVIQSETAPQAKTPCDSQGEDEWEYGREGVIRLLFTLSDDQHLYFVLELAINGELLGWIKKMGSFDLDTSRFYSAQILSAIAFMHKRGVLHRDLKPENILLDANMRVKISDFGTAKLINAEPYGPQCQVDEGRSNSFVGTAEYVSPELLKDKSSCKASDMWAFGCILYQLIAGRPPFKAPNDYLTFQKILKLEYEFPQGFYEDAKEVVKSMLMLSPDSRPSPEALRNHSFFSDIDFSQLWSSFPPPLNTGIIAPSSAQTSDSNLNIDGIDWVDSDGEEDMLNNSWQIDYYKRSSSKPNETQSETNTRHNGSASMVSTTGYQSATSTTFSSQHSTRSKSSSASVLSSDRKWSSILKLGESVIYSSDVHSRATGLIPLTRRRKLAITSDNRVLCAKEGSSSMKLQTQVELDDESEIESRNEKSFIIMNHQKAAHFVAENEESRNTWLEYLREAVKDCKAGES